MGMAVDAPPFPRRDLAGHLEQCASHPAWVHRLAWFPRQHV